MAAWFRKGTGITSAASAVSGWADQSGNGRDYAQATGANQPDVTASGTILFNGSSDTLKTADFTLAQPYTRYFRLKQVTWTDTDYIADGNTTNVGGIAQRGVTPAIDLFAGGGGAAASNTALAVGAWGSLCAVFNGASSVLQINDTTTTGDPGASAAGGLTLGASGGGTSPSNIEVAEEIVYSVAHDATQRADVIAYLNSVGP